MNPGNTLEKKQDAREGSRVSLTCQRFAVAPCGKHACSTPGDEYTLLHEAALRPLLRYHRRILGLLKGSLGDAGDARERSPSEPSQRNENQSHDVLVDVPKILLRWNDMPRHLQFNPHIRSGYRPLMTIRGCLGSLFYLHNETINILTHGLAIVYILVSVPCLLPWSTKGALTEFLSWCHLIGALSPWIGSFLYHLFMNLNFGDRAYKRLLKLDMLGIWICQSFGAMPMIAAFVHCLPDVLWFGCLLSYCFLSFWGLVKAMRARSPWERRLCFSPPFMMRLLVLTLRCFDVGGGSPDAFPHILLQDLVAVVGGTIGALRIPEKWIPGRVDMVLNSHNIMHVMVVLAVCSMHAATLYDLEWMTSTTVCTSPNSGLSPIHQEL